MTTPPPAKEIACPVCKERMHLEDFTITEHPDGTWSADPSIVCPNDECAFKFFITRGRVDLVGEPLDPK